MDTASADDVHSGNSGRHGRLARRVAAAAPGCRVSLFVIKSMMRDPTVHQQPPEHHQKAVHLRVGGGTMVGMGMSQKSWAWSKILTNGATGRRGETDPWQC